LVNAVVDVDQEQVSERVPRCLAVATRHIRGHRPTRPGRAAIK